MQPNGLKSNRGGLGRKLLLAWGIIILVIGCVAAPVLLEAQRERKQVTSEANLKVLGAALIQYEQDYDGKLPTLADPASFKAALNSYVPNQKDGRDPFVDPVTNQTYETSSTLSYKEAAKLPKRSVLVIEPGTFHGRQMALFSDGHVDNALQRTAP